MKETEREDRNENDGEGRGGGEVDGCETGVRRGGI